MVSKQGTLYVVGVAIGNYDDMTFRAVEILKKVDVIAAEDTRKSRHLLAHFQITPDKVISHHTHNEADSSKGLFAMLKEGQNIALITDAGMPAISDPGYKAVCHVRENGGVIKIIPGVSAMPTALAISGLPAEDFRFIGFLPRKKGDIGKILKGLATQTSTLVLFESPRRIIKTLQILQEHLGNRQACLCRELTKTHEEIISTTLQDIEQQLESRAEVLGEITLVVAGADKNAAQISDADLAKVITKALKTDESPRALRDRLCEEYGLNKRDIYQRIINSQK